MWTATVVSRFGDAVRGPAMALLAAGLTRDPLALALVVVAGQIPSVLFGLIGGARADRWDRRFTMAVTDGLRCLLVLALAVVVATGQASVPVLVAFALALSTIGTLFDASSFAILPELVPADRLPMANGRLQAGTTVSGGLLGAPVASGLFAVAAALPFTVDAATFAVAAVLAVTLPRPVHPTAATGAPPRPRLLGDAVTGVRWLVRQSALLLLPVLGAGPTW